MLHKFLINPIKLAVVALLVVSVSSAMAEWKQATQSQGNNIGLTVSLSYGGPLRTSPWPHQFPRGSGNTITAGRWNWGVNIARDTNGDGVVNDTAANLSRGGRFQGMLCALEDMDQLSALAAAGEDMYDASTRLSTNRCYTTTDPGDVAEWPARFREGRTMSGAPIVHGAETIALAYGDCFADDGRTMGASIEYRFHFLNFAESNNMAYMHVFFRQMSEYNKWNPNADFLEKIAGTAETGQNWAGMQLVYTTANGFRIGGRDEAWGYLFPRQIIIQADRDGVEGSFTTAPATMAMMPFRLPEHKGQTLTFTNTLAHGWNTEFGGPAAEEVLEGGYPNGRAYRYGNGRYDPIDSPFYPAYVNPWTDGPLYGWPGVPLPDEPRYDQWIWGTKNANNSYNFWGEFKDVAPRDSFSLDCVIAFVPPKNPPFSFPPSDITEIDNAMVQDQLGAVEDYMDVAEAVYGGNFVLPETPAPPPLTIIPGEKQVTITWSDVNINTPDAYYGFLQDNPSLDPGGLYREYDFEGYRLYRSYVGPSDSHSELLMDCSLSAGNLQFYYVDTRDSDNPLFRMSNGMRVWYALVPYDNNTDPAEGTSFSLPDPASGKTWNRPGAQLYTVQPRSDASNFRAATLDATTLTYQGPAQVDAISVELSGDGSGKLTEAPKWLIPQVGDLEFTALNSERITADMSVNIECSAHGKVNWGGCNYPATSRTVQITDGWGVDFTVRNRGGEEATVVLNSPVDSEGANYAISAEFLNISQGNWRNDTYDDWNTGTYSGASVAAARYRCGARIGSAPNVLGWTKEGQYTVTWKDAGDGNLSVDIMDDTRGAPVSFGAYMDDIGWGIAPKDGTIGDRWGGDNLYNDMVKDTPRADRGNAMSQTISAANTEEFGIYLAGIFWVFSDVTEMPAAGTVMTCTVAFGSWNDDKTVFTQLAPPPWPGDKWKVDIKASTMNADDADLSKIMVVPNPYMASSALDLSPSQRRLEFVNLPARCTIRIYSLGGHLVNVLNHIGANRHGWGDYSDVDRLDSNGNPREFTGWDNHGGTEAWNLQNRFGQTVASGLYFYHVTDERGETHTGKFYVIN